MKSRLWTVGAGLVAVTMSVACGTLLDIDGLNFDTSSGGAGGAGGDSTTTSGDGGTTSGTTASVVTSTSASSATVSSGTGGAGTCPDYDAPREKLDPGLNPTSEQDVCTITEIGNAISACNGVDNSGCATVSAACRDCLLAAPGGTNIPAWTVIDGSITLPNVLACAAMNALAPECAIDNNNLVLCAYSACAPCSDSSEIDMCVQGSIVDDASPCTFSSLSARCQMVLQNGEGTGECSGASEAEALEVTAAFFCGP